MPLDDDLIPEALRGAQAPSWWDDGGVSAGSFTAGLDG
jgi:hypothetical protein